MKRRSVLEQAFIPNFRRTPLFFALMLWICTLPLLAFLAAPFLGWKVAAFLAGFLLVADLVICRSVCRVRIPEDPVICARCLERLSAQVLYTQAKIEDQKKIV